MKPIEKQTDVLLRNFPVFSRIFVPLFMIGLAAATGTAGYHLLEGWPWRDALYMTIITMTTVGYGEVWPLSDAGQYFTIGLIMTSIGIAGYAVSKATAFIIEGEVRNIIKGHQMDKRIAKLRNHIILCGAGHTGAYIAEEFSNTRTTFVVIEQDPEAMEDVAHLKGMLYLQDDATQDEVLLTAGIKQARGLITTLSEDKDNIFVTLCARSLNPGLRIIARLFEDSNAELLRKAGADEIISPNAIGGLRMASVMLRPTVVAFLDEMLRMTGQTLRMEEIHVNDMPALRNHSLIEADLRRRTGLLVVAVKSQEQGYQFNPDPTTVLRNGDVLIVIGTESQLRGVGGKREKSLKGITGLRKSRQDRQR